MDTLITFFLKYLLAPLAVLFLLIILKFSKVKKKLNMKKVILFILIASIILVLPAFFGLLKYEFIWGGLLITMVIYLLLGVGLVFYTNSNSFKSLGLIDEKEQKTYFYIVILIILILAAWGYYLLFNWLSKLPYSIWVMTSVLWSMVPLFYIITRDVFLKITPPFFKAWQVKSDANNDSYWDKIDTFTLIQVTAKVKRKPSDEEYASFAVKLPTEVILGKWFDRFIEDQNVRFPQDVIRTTDESGDGMGWIFYTSKWFSFPLFTRVLDADKTGSENNINDKQVIFVRRIKIKQDENE
ncbi:TssN family type VI secretion system protein [Mariniflexile ostreae]|uniref:TssN family type VI secretion system protein n=1 Tax=Mariniflexile ostreae TaxID=1520892 RepID=A0ABV5FA00_9FLAO